jgi:hypothetical protein
VGPVNPANPVGPVDPVNPVVPASPEILKPQLPTLPLPPTATAFSWRLVPLKVVMYPSKYLVLSNVEYTFT